MLVWGAGHAMAASAVSCAAAILSCYSENHTGVIENIISWKGMGTGKGVGTEWAYMYKTVF